MPELTMEQYKYMDKMRFICTIGKASIVYRNARETSNLEGWVQFPVEVPKMIAYYNCINNDLDPDRCGKFKIGFWNIGDRCNECTDFLFFNWKAIDLPREAKIRLYRRLRK